MRPSISIVLPTVGRDTLVDTLDSLVAAGLARYDEILVMADGPKQESIGPIAFRHPVNEIAKVCVTLMEDRGGFWGHPGRNEGMAQATKRLVMFTQDDQLFVPGALKVVREVVLASKHWDKTGHIFQVVPRNAGIVPVKVGAMAVGFIDADCVCVPRNLLPFCAEWTNHYCGDNDFIVNTANNLRARGSYWQYHLCLISVHHGKRAQYAEMFEAQK